MRTCWEPTWDGGEQEHEKGPGCGLAMGQARASQRRIKVERDFLEDCLMFVLLLWKEKGEGGKCADSTVLGDVVCRTSDLVAMRGVGQGTAGF